MEHFSFIEFSVGSVIFDMLRFIFFYIFTWRYMQINSSEFIMVIWKLFEHNSLWIF